MRTVFYLFALVAVSGIALLVTGAFFDLQLPFWWQVAHSIVVAFAIVALVTNIWTCCGPWDHESDY